MSTKLMALAWGVPLRPVEKLVLLALCDQAGDDGMVSPGGDEEALVRGLCALLAMPEQAVAAALGVLSEGPHVEWTGGAAIVNEGSMRRAYVD
jgi:hypothetical protein